MTYQGYERRQESGWKITKTVDVGTVITSIVLLIALFGMSNKLESRLSTLEAKVEMIISGRLK